MLSKDDGFKQVQVAVGSNKFPLRDIQIAELRQWLQGSKFDKDWLVIKSGMPHSFIAQDGTENRLHLDPEPEQEAVVDPSLASAAAELASAAEAAVKQAKEATRLSICTLIPPTLAALQSTVVFVKYVIRSPYPNPSLNRPVNF